MDADALLFARGKDESGYTTLGMAVALLVALSMVFAGAQVYRVSSASATIQDVADASALAAENQVSQFMTAVRLCDAVVLSLTLTSLAATGLGVAALCTPVTAEASEQLLEAGEKIARARTSFSENAKKALGVYQEALPFLSAASAWSVARANCSSVDGSDYLALAVLAPGDGEEISVKENEDAEDVQQEASESADSIKESAEEAEDAAKEANEAKQRAFEADCGANPGYCMYERAATLASMEGGDNPLYKSVDAWSFSVALNRAQAYYRERYVQEAPEGSSVEEQANSALRENMYRYACELLGEGYVVETEDTFEASFPTLPRNTDEMRRTSLYTEAVYPVTEDEEGALTMHAYPGCPSAAGYSALGSVSEMESGGYATCPDCGFSASDLGSVCSASTSISNGFEYHYLIVAEAAEEYQAAKEELEPAESEVKQEATSLLEKIKDAVETAADYRIEASPPGRYGAIALVVDASQASYDKGFESAFVQSDASLGTRAAVSGATLLADSADDQGNVLTQMLDGIRGEGGAAVGLAGVLLDCWGGLLSAYADGQSALESAVSGALDAIPFASQSGLGTWAAKKLEGLIEGVGLQPAELDALKPVLVNTSSVAEKDSGGFSVRYLSVKRASLAAVGGTTLFSSLVDEVADDLREEVSGEIELAKIEPLGEGGPSIPIVVALPSAAQEASSGAIDSVADWLKSVAPSVGGEDSWS